MITITKKAETHLANLKSKPENADKELRIEALDPNTPYAEAGISFVTPSPEHTDDIMQGFNGFNLFIDRKSQSYLEDASIDLKAEGTQKELIITTPNLEALSLLDADLDLASQVQFILETEINPNLAAHGGMARLVEITEDNVVVLQFGGGCQGCSMIDTTLTHGVEEALKAKLPEIKAVKDATDHLAGKNPYY